MPGSAAVKLFAISLLISVTAACAPIVAVHGNYVEAERMAQIHEGISRKADITDLLGTPTAVATFDPTLWYYIGQRTEKVAFYPPEVVDREILALHFDAGGTLRQVEKLDASAGREIALEERTTPTAGKDLSFLEQILGNVGRFSGTKKDTGPGH